MPPHDKMPAGLHNRLTMSLFLGIESTTLSADDQRRIAHPDCAGVILFTRNYQDLRQLRELSAAIRKVKADILLCVDQEGGRVQRFRGEGFTPLPEAATFGRVFDQRPLLACELAQMAGIILAYELRQADLDFSFAPVLDLQDTRSSVIGARAFHANPAVVAALSIAMRNGMRQLGMAAVGKHYPGHGRIEGDSHHTLPEETRSYAEREADRYPFFVNIRDGIEAIMSAHILLPEDTLPGGFSARCLNELREAGFQGVIFSDDLDMAGAHFFPDPSTRVQAAFTAGADAALICNRFADMDQVLADPPVLPDRTQSAQRLHALRARPVDPATAASHYARAQTEFARHRDTLNMA